MKKWLKKKFKNERGLTLVELLAVIVILAIVAVIAFVMIGNVIENSKKDAHIANALQIISAAKLYDTSDGMEENSVNVSELIEKGYLEPLNDPWSEDNTYGNSASVTKNSSGNYQINSFKGKNCNINSASESTLANVDRDDLCNDYDESETD